MNHTRIEMVVSRSCEHELNEWLDTHKDEVALFDYCQREEDGRYSFGFRIWPEGLHELIGQLLKDNQALVMKYDDVGNPPNWFFGNDITFEGPSAQDEDQDTIRTDTKCFDALEHAWIRMLRA